MSEATRQKKFSVTDRDTIHDLLSNHRRRYTIHYCKQHENPVSLSDLAEQIAAWEQDKDIKEITSAERKRVYTSLQQTHLDRLNDAGMVDYDGHEIELTDGAEELEVYLDVVPSGSIPWSIYYLGLTLLSAVVLFGVWIDFVPTETIPAVGWAAIILAVFLGSSLYHVYQAREFRLGEMERPP